MMGKPFFHKTEHTLHLSVTERLLSLGAHRIQFLLPFGSSSKTLNILSFLVFRQNKKIRAYEFYSKSTPTICFPIAGAYSFLSFFVT